MSSASPTELRTSGPADVASEMAQRAERPRIRGLDAIRFVCALWVVVSHVGQPPVLAGISRDTKLGYAVSAAYGSSVSGVAAVIVFFVISGFCIHYPYQSEAPSSWSDYFARRYLRIGAPLLAALALSLLTGYGAARLNSEILWSLYAEIAYYTVYPVVRWARIRYGWNSVLLISALAAATVVGFFRRAGNYHDPGVAFTWILGLPCWLLGCVLAEKIDVTRQVSRPRIIGWRVAVWFASCVCLVLRFHSPIGYVWTLDLFAILVFYWLRDELAFSYQTPPPEWLERAGLWSYSLYIVHMLAASKFRDGWYERLSRSLGFLGAWVLTIAAILLAAYAFYVTVERPSHQLARRIRRRPMVAPLSANEARNLIAPS